MDEYRIVVREGQDGVRGLPGTPAPPQPPIVAGGPGGHGGVGTNAGAAMLRNVNWAGTEFGLNQGFYVGLQTHGADGGDGGNGGGGSRSRATSTENVSGEWFERVTEHTPGSDGGAGGNGGQGVTVATRLQAVTLNDLDVVYMSANAFGGRGGSAGHGGGGGFSDVTTRSIDPWSQSIIRQVGAPGGAGGQGGVGGMGGDASALFSSLRLTDVDSLSIRAVVSGGGGGHGGLGGQGETGALGGAAGAGGAGARGAGGVVRFTDIFVQDGEATNNTVSIHGSAAGGAGGEGTRAGVAGWGVLVDSLRVEPSDTPGAWLTAESYLPGAAAGSGAGGDGGNATVELRAGVFEMGGGNDHITVELSATAGMGGRGGTGTPAIEGFSQTTIGSDIEVVYAAAGPDGAPGAHGRAAVVVMNNHFAMGDGDDTLRFDLSTSGVNRLLSFRGNVIDGGTGTDTLDFAGTGWGATFDVSRGFLTLAGSRNTMTGFEVFRGTDVADLFIDGVGNQTYRGGDGADHFRFTRTHGHDTIEAFTAQDVIEFSRIGARMDGFPDVLARSVNTASGVVIDTGYGGSLTLTGWFRESLTADLFAYS